MDLGSASDEHCCMVFRILFDGSLEVKEQLGCLEEFENSGVDSGCGKNLLCYVQSLFDLVLVAAVDCFAISL